MDQDWDSVTRIGSAVRGGANAPKERVIKGSAVNAAKRAGHAISTEKKYAGGSNKVKLQKFLTCLCFRILR